MSGFHKNLHYLIEKRDTDIDWARAIKKSLDNGVEKLPHDICYTITDIEKYKTNKHIQITFTSPNYSSNNTWISIKDMDGFDSIEVFFTEDVMPYFKDFFTSDSVENNDKIRLINLFNEKFDFKWNLTFVMLLFVN